jgi:hypothetical protein
MTGAPQRNFDLPIGERIAALVAGPPAFARRLRAIEDLEDAIVRSFVEEAEGRAEGLDPARWRTTAHQRLSELVIRHNRYYPVEANLPACLRTGELLDRDGTPWRPRRCPSMEELAARTRLITGR